MVNNDFKLSTIPYERIAIDVIESEGENIKKGLVQAKSAEEQFKIHKKYYKLVNKVYKNILVARTRYNGNVKDEFYAKENTYCNEMELSVKKFELEYKKYYIILNSKKRLRRR